MNDLIDLTSLPPNFADLYDVEGALSVALSGGTYDDIAAALGMCTRTLMRLRLKHPLFRESIERARIIGREAIHDGIRTIVDRNLHLSPQLVKIKSDNDIWFLKTCDPVKYGDRVLVQSEDINLKDALSQARTRVIEHTPKPSEDPFAGT
jgi:hypothetical protein